jgi:hypothetical protein
MGLRIAFLARFIGRCLVALRFIAGRASEYQVKMRIAAVPDAFQIFEGLDGTFAAGLTCVV